jgi:hypothetical protein
MASDEEKSITIDDTPVNRYKKFIIYAITYFNLMVSTELSMAKSKDNVKANKYLTTAIGESTSVTFNMYNFGKAAGTVAAPLTLGLGAFANLILKDFAEDRIKVRRFHKEILVFKKKAL